MSDAGWNVIGLIAVLCLKEFFDQRRARAAEARDVAAQDRSEQRAQATQLKLAVVADRVEEVHKATNGLSKAMGDAKLAQGTAEGKAVGLAEGRQTVVDAGHDQALLPQLGQKVEIKGEVTKLP